MQYWIWASTSPASMTGLAALPITPREFSENYSLGTLCITPHTLAYSNTAVFLRSPFLLRSTPRTLSTRHASSPAVRPTSSTLPIRTRVRRRSRPVDYSLPFLRNPSRHLVTCPSFLVTYRHLSYYHLSSVRRAGGRGETVSSLPSAP